MKKSGKQTAILILSHVANKSFDAHFHQISDECGEKFRVVSLCDNSSGLFDDKQDRENHFLFTIEQLSRLNFPGKAPTYSQKARRANPHHKEFNFRPGSIELPVLLYYRHHPEHDYYWVVEYDVRYSGSWDHFFSYFDGSDTDLLGTTMNRFDEVPNWFHWKALNLRSKPIAKKDYIRGFFPIYRISKRALEQLDRDYQTGVGGHFECLGPTLLRHAGLTIEDIGGDGAFVRPQNINRFYVNTPESDTLAPGTFVFRPAIHRPGREPNKLWHPVKHLSPWRIAFRTAKRTISRRQRDTKPASRR
jgi:Protein of unknown function (DUF3405)